MGGRGDLDAGPVKIDLYPNYRLALHRCWCGSMHRQSVINHHRYGLRRFSGARFGAAGGTPFLSDHRYRGSLSSPPWRRSWY